MSICSCDVARRNAPSVLTYSPSRFAQGVRDLLFHLRKVTEVTDAGARVRYDRVDFGNILEHGPWSTLGAPLEHSWRPLVSSYDA